MKLNKYTVIFVSCIAAVAVSAMLVFSGKESPAGEEKEVTRKQDNIEESAEPTEEPYLYEVRLEGNTVILYKTENGGRTPVDSVEIDVHYYPDSDIRELTKGIKAYNEEEGYKILENFVN